MMVELLPPAPEPPQRQIELPTIVVRTKLRMDQDGVSSALGL
jgi:hypothetical protein